MERPSFILFVDVELQGMIAPVLLLVEGHHWLHTFEVLSEVYIGVRVGGYRLWRDVIVVARELLGYTAPAYPGTVAFVLMVYRRLAFVAVAQEVDGSSECCPVAPRQHDGTQENGGKTIYPAFPPYL